MFNIQASIEKRHWLCIGFAVDTSMDEIRSFVAKSGGHLFHTFESCGYIFVYILFPTELSLREMFLRAFRKESV